MAQATKGGQHSHHHYDLTVEVPMREEAIDSAPMDITFCVVAPLKHTRILGATADKRTGESIIIKNGSQAKAFICSERRSVHADMRYMPLYAWLAYSLFLAFSITCELFIIGKACHLSS